jgi:hypothetical protein
LKNQLVQELPYLTDSFFSGSLNSLTATNTVFGKNHSRPRSVNSAMRIWRMGTGFSKLNRNSWTAISIPLVLGKRNPLQSACATTALRMST